MIDRTCVLVGLFCMHFVYVNANGTVVTPSPTTPRTCEDVVDARYVAVEDCSPCVECGCLFCGSSRVKRYHCYCGPYSSVFEACEDQDVSWDRDDSDDYFATTVEKCDEPFGPTIPPDLSPLYYAAGIGPAIVILSCCFVLTFGQKDDTRYDGGTTASPLSTEGPYVDYVITISGAIHGNIHRNYSSSLQTLSEYDHQRILRALNSLSSGFRVFKARQFNKLRSCYFTSNMGMSILFLSIGFFGGFVMTFVGGTDGNYVVVAIGIICICMFVVGVACFVRGAEEQQSGLQSDPGVLISIKTRGILLDRLHDKIIAKLNTQYPQLLFQIHEFDRDNNLCTLRISEPSIPVAVQIKDEAVYGKIPKAEIEP